MPNAWTMRPGAGRKAAPPVRDKKRALPATRMDAAAAGVADDLAGERRDVNGEDRGPAWLRRRYPPRPAGGADRKTVL